jgi:hypothetical protein
VDDSSGRKRSWVITEYWDFAEALVEAIWNILPAVDLGSLRCLFDPCLQAFWVVLWPSGE